MSRLERSKAQTLTPEDKKAHVEGTICINYGQLDVCYGPHEERHCSRSASCQQVHEQSRGGSLESYQVDFEISERVQIWHCAVMGWMFICTDM